MNRKRIDHIILLSLTAFIVGLSNQAQAQMPNSQPAQPNGYPGFTPQNPTGNWPSVAGNNGDTNNPVANSYNNPFASFNAPQYKSDFWTKTPILPGVQSGNVISAGTVLTGILQEDISSKKSKAGDVFSIMLIDDYKVNNQILIPKNSSFVGSVVSAAPAKKGLNGTPGSLQVSLQTLVSPDGTSIPVNAFIDYDPNQHQKTDIKKSRGVPVGEWAKSIEYSIYYAVGGIGSRLGVPVLYKGQTGSGAEFSLTQGELLPVRLSQPLDVTPLLAHTPANSQNAMPTNIMPADNAPPIAPSPSQNNMPTGENILPGNLSPAGPKPF